MELYIEKEFLINFYIEVDNNNLSDEEEIVIAMFTDYGDKDVFMDCKISDMDKLSRDNEYFALICAKDKWPIEIENFENQLFKSSFSQTLVFADKEQDWFKEAENKGALCFSFMNFKSKIKEIIKHCHKIDFLKGVWKKEDWKIFEQFKLLPYNSVLINDKYVINEKDTVVKNLMPFFENFLIKRVKNINIEIYSKTNNNPKDEKGREKIENELKTKERLKKTNNLLLSHFANFNVKFSYKNIKDKSYRKIDFHDRFLLTNFLYFKIGRGFDLTNGGKLIDTDLLAMTIFSNQGYKKIREKKEEYSTYKNWLSKSSASGFKSYP